MCRGIHLCYLSDYPLIDNSVSGLSKWHLFGPLWFLSANCRQQESGNAEKLATAQDTHTHIEILVQNNARKGPGTKFTGYYSYVLSLKNRSDAFS